MQFLFLQSPDLELGKVSPISSQRICKPCTPSTGCSRNGNAGRISSTLHPLAANGFILLLVGTRSKSLFFFPMDEKTELLLQQITWNLESNSWEKYIVTTVEKRNFTMAQSGIFLLNTQQVQIPPSSTSFAEQIQIPSLFYDQIRHIPKSYKASLIDLKSALLLRLKNLREPFFFTGKEKKITCLKDMFSKQENVFKVFYTNKSLFHSLLKHWKKMAPQ